MSTAWQQKRLADLGSLRNGMNFNRHQEGPGIPVLKVKDFGDSTFVPISGLDELDTTQIRVSDEQLLQDGDVVIIRSNGNIALVGRSLVFRESPRPVTFSGFCIRFRPDRNQLDPRFAAYFIRSPFCRQRLSAYGSGTGIQNLSQDIIGGVPIDLPPLSEQKRVSEILGALDDKIELNRRMNETLEAMARALFQSWFVDFDPVHAKAAVRREHPNWSNAQVSRAALPNLAPALAERFPDHFVDSELGQIPARWQIQSLDDLTSKIGSGATPRGGSKVYIDAGVALVRSQNVYDGEFIWDGLARITDAAAQSLDGVTLEPEDVLFNITGASILRTCVVDPEVLPARVNQHVARIRAKPEVSSRFLHMHLVRKEMKDHLLGFNAGATREAITKGHLQAVRLVVPTAEIMRHFGESATALYSQKQSILKETRSLSAARDALLPRLLSGQYSPEILMA
jgi:type I restriction enzyme, S subunit